MITVLVEPGRGEGLPITFALHHDTIEGTIVVTAVAAAIAALGAIVRATFPGTSRS